MSRRSLDNQIKQKAHELRSKLSELGKRLEAGDERHEALQAFDNLPKPVLLHCSAGIDRSSPVAAFIFVNSAEEP